MEDATVPRTFGNFGGWIPVGKSTTRGERWMETEVRLRKRTFGNILEEYADGHKNDGMGGIVWAKTLPDWKFKDAITRFWGKLPQLRKPGRSPRTVFQLECTVLERKTVNQSKFSQCDVWERENRTCAFMKASPRLAELNTLPSVRFFTTVVNVRYVGLRSHDAQWSDRSGKSWNQRIWENLITQPASGQVAPANWTYHVPNQLSTICRIEIKKIVHKSSRHDQAELKRAPKL